MAGFKKYAQMVFMSDVANIYNSCCDKIYPFNKYESNKDGRDLPIYENNTLVLDALLVILLVPLLIILLLVWNIIRIFPIGKEYQNAFPDKIFDLANGKNRADYFSDNVSKHVMEQEFIAELKKVTRQDNIDDVAMFMRDIDVDDLYRNISLSNKKAIVDNLYSFFDDLTFNPAENFMQSFQQLFSFGDVNDQSEFTTNNNRGGIKFKGKSLNFGGHLWLSFSKHLYRSYAALDRFGLMPMQNNDVIDGSNVNYSKMDGLNIFCDRGLHVLQAFKKSSHNELDNYLGSDDGSGKVNILKKFALLWFVAEQVRWRNNKKGVENGQEYASIYIEGDKDCEDFFGSVKKPHKDSFFQFAYESNLSYLAHSIKDIPVKNAPKKTEKKKGFRFFSKQDTKAQEKKSTRARVPKKWTDESPERVFVQNHINAIKASDDPEITARHEAPVWLNNDYFFTGETISKTDYLSQYQVSDEDRKKAKDWPSELAFIRHKKDFRDLLQPSEVPIWYNAILVIPRLFLALLNTAIQAASMVLQLVLSLIIALIPFCNLYLYRPISSKTGQAVTSICGLAVSIFVLIDMVTCSFPLVSYCSSFVINAIYGYGWSFASAVAIYNLFIVTLFFSSFLLARLSYHSLNSEHLFSEEKNNIKCMQNSCYITYFSLFLCLGLFAAITYPGLIISEAKISIAVSLAGGLGVSAAIVASLVLSITTISSFFVKKEDNLSIGLNYRHRGSVLGDPTNNPTVQGATIIPSERFGATAGAILHLPNL